MQRINRIWPFFDQFLGGFTAAAVAAEQEYDPVWLQCLEATRDVLRELAADDRLEGIDSASIIMLEQPLVSQFYGKDDAGNSLLPYPGAIVWPGTKETITDYSNFREGVDFPIVISFVDKGAGSTGTSAMVSDRDKIRQHMLWREKASQRFRYSEWPDIEEVEKSTVQPESYLIPELYRHADIYHGALVIVFSTLAGRVAS